jgi:hypothetical protein
VAWIRRVRTASGATAVQIAEYDGGLASWFSEDRQLATYTTLVADTAASATMTCRR